MKLFVNRLLNKRAIFCLLGLVSLSLGQKLTAQTVFEFKNGLAVGNAYHYGREALYSDVLAWQMYTGNLKTPAASTDFGLDEKGQSQKWEVLSLNERKRFSNRKLGSMYLYLTYQSEREQSAVLNIKGNSAFYLNGVLHTGDPYALNWMYVPVKLKKGLNELYVRGQNISASLSFPAKPVSLNTEDATVPDIVLTKDNGNLMAAVVLINTTANTLKGLTLQTAFKGGKKVNTVLPGILPMTTRKVMFKIDASSVNTKNNYPLLLSLRASGKEIDTATLTMEAVEPSASYKNTFVSQIDGSLQYYGVTPKLGTSLPGDALFFSVHGAGVEAIGQAKAYRSKDWGNVVTPTNRRPRGFNWEDWGRLDALEVLAEAKQQFRPDPQHIYLTGHSMGGHGTWFLGATYPDQWAAIAPCSGYPTLKGYGSADGLIPDSSSFPMESMLIRASNQSDVIKLAKNYQSLGVYVLHGDSDKVVSVNYARQMKKVLASFHTDYSYYEYPGGEHWFGDQSVDWKPIYDFFKWHHLKADTSINQIDFTTANPGVSAKFHWAAVQQQEQPLQYSNIKLSRDLKKGTVTGTTKNIKVLKLSFPDIAANTSLALSIDGSTVQYETKSNGDSIYLVKTNSSWGLGGKPDQHQKSPERNGTFKDGFKHNMVLVYGTSGSVAENEWSINKVRYDAETWYYRGNGAVDIIADKDYSQAKYKGRNVVLYGTASSNSAWKVLLNDCPIKVQRNRIQAGTKEWTGDDLGAYFVWPIKGTAHNSVSVIAGTGAKGLNTAFANQYLAGGSGFPDIFIFRLNMLKEGDKGVEMAGFFDNNWKIDPKMAVQQ